MSNTKIFVYTANKFMLYTINEVLKNNFSCEVICDTPPKSHFETIFNNKASDIILFDSDMLFDNNVRDTLNARTTLKAIALVNGEVDYGLRHIISGYADAMIDNTYDVDIIVLIVTSVMKGFQCMPLSRMNTNMLGAQLSQLTQREQEVLHYVSQGVSNKSIADFLGVSYKTVCVHRYNIAYKLKLKKLPDPSCLKSFRQS